MQGGCTNYWKKFTVGLNMIDVIDKQQMLMYDSVIVGKVNA